MVSHNLLSAMKGSKEKERIPAPENQRVKFEDDRLRSTSDSGYTGVKDEQCYYADEKENKQNKEKKNEEHKEEEVKGKKKEEEVVVVVKEKNKKRKVKGKGKGHFCHQINLLMGLK